MAHVGGARLGDRVEVDVNDLVEVAGHDLCDRVELLVVEACRGEAHGQANGGEVADRDLVGRRVLDNLRAQVGALDGSEVLLVALDIARILPPRMA